MGIVLDLIIVGIIVFSIFLSARHGFVRSLIEVVGFIAAFSIAFTISSPLAKVTYDKIIGPKIVAKVESITSDGGSSVASQIWDAFPGVIKNNSAELGIDQQSFLNKVDSTISSGASDSAVKISEDVTRPIVIRLVGAFYSTVITGVLIILIRFLARIINKSFKIALLGKINGFLGGVLGAVKGIVFAFIFCAIISVVVLLTKDGLWFFTPANIASSSLFKLIYGFSPFL